MRIALLVIDLQKGYYGPSTKKSYDSAISSINALLPLFRAKEYPIAWIQHIEEAEGVVPGSPDFDFVGSLEPGSGERRIHKRYNDGFNKTELAAFLREEKVDTVLISGFCAEYCIVSTYVGALDNDFTPIMLRDGIASGSEEALRVIGGSYEHATSGAIKKLLE